LQKAPDLLKRSIIMENRISCWNLCAKNRLFLRISSGKFSKIHINLQENQPCSRC